MRATGAADFRIASGMPDDERMAHDLSRIDAHRFEQMVLALGVHVLGSGMRAFGAGADGGREATFDGRVPFPVPGPGAWSGYGVVQAKCRRTNIGVKDAEWLIRQINSEVRAWLDPSGRRAQTRRPQYLIIATNVRLTSTAISGGIDRVTTVMKKRAAELGLLDWAVWDGNQLSTYLDAYPQVARTFAEAISPGEVLAKTWDALHSLQQQPLTLAIRVGQGHPGNERPFTIAYDKAGGPAWLGTPTSEAYEEGPGWVQQFATAVICGAYERPAVAVHLDVWEALVEAGAGYGRLAAVGFPLVDDRTPPFIADTAERVRLQGGSWGAGGLVRHGQGWEWEPELVLSSDIRDHDRWGHPEPRMDLRLRCALRFASRAGQPLVIGTPGRKRLKAAFAHSAVARYVSDLAARWGLDSLSGWERTPDNEGYNDARFACYRAISGQPGGPVLGVWVRVGLPDGMRNEVSCIVDLRIEFGDLGAVAGSSPSGRRLDAADVIRFFSAAWQANAQVLPLTATSEPFGLKVVGAPTFECHIVAERAPGQGAPHPVALPQTIDFSVYGQPPNWPSRLMGGSAAAPMFLSEQHIPHVVEALVARMASGYGYLESED